MEEAKAHLEVVRRWILKIDWEKDNFHLVNLCRDASHLYERLNLLDRALALQKLYNEINESQSRKQMEEELQQLRIKYETQEKETQILALELDNQRINRQRNQFLWGFILLIVILIAFFSFYRQRRQFLEREAGRLKEIDAFKTRLHTNITHEFRTPLTVIMGTAAEIRGNDKAKAMIRRNGQKLLDLINQMLALRKLEAKALSLEPVQDDILPFIQYVFESFQSVTRSKNIQLTFHTELEGLVMDYDPEKLRQILANLLSNAVKFTPENGSIRLRVAEEDKHLVLRVEDNGIGIPQKDLPHLFDRFYQVDNSATRRQGGAGIGLALVKELVELKRGEIEVASTPGEGTAFAIRLPITREAPLQSVFSEPPTAKAPLAEAPVLANLSAGEKKEDAPLALIVEDNEDVAAYLHSCLREDYRVEWARNGQEGIDRALEQVPDIIISDVMMPKKDGFALCRTLKQDERTSHIPIILLTARATREDKLEGLERGADAYLAKPFDRKELALRLRKLMELRRQLREKYRQSGLLELETDSATDPEINFLKKLQQVVLDNLDNEGFKVEPDLCRAMTMSRPQLYRKLKALKDRSPSDFIREVRMQQARHLLLQTQLQIGDIAARVGFKNSSYFTKTYTATFGENPSETRNRTS